MLGGSVQSLRYPRRLTRFARRNRAAPAARPSAFFSVGLAIISHHQEDRAQAAATPREWLARCGWRPRIVRLFAGAELFTRYGPRKRRMMLRFAEEDRGVRPDPRRDHDHTDWAQVDAFADEVAGLGAPARSTWRASDELRGE